MNLDNINVEFQKLFSSKIESVYVCPGRVNLIGEHIDYNGGNVLPFAINLKIKAYVSARNDMKICLSSKNIADSYFEIDLAKEKIKKTKEWYGYPIGIFNQFMEEGREISHGINILFDSEIPLASGLSSSAAILVLTAKIVSDTYGFGFTNKDIALLAHKSEYFFNGVHCGIMDQFAVALCDKDQACLINCETYDTKNYPLHFGDYELVLMNTNYKRKLSDSLYNKRREECDEAFRILEPAYKISNLCELKEENLFDCFTNLHYNDVLYRRVKHVVTEQKRVSDFCEALESDDVLRMGELLNQSDYSLINDYEVAGPNLEAMTKFARQNEHCIGARMTGAGMGGFAIALVQKDHIKEFIEEVSMKYEKEMKIKPTLFTVLSSSGVGKIQ